jgi:hypothetical protein
MREVLSRRNVCTLLGFGTLAIGATALMPSQAQSTPEIERRQERRDDRREGREDRRDDRQERRDDRQGRAAKTGATNGTNQILPISSSDSAANHCNGTGQPGLDLL